MRIQEFLIAASLFAMVSCESGSAGNADQTNESEAVEVTETNVEESEVITWTGTYRTKAACSECEGISKEISLKDDLSFVQITRHAGSHFGDVSEMGKFEWDDEAAQIIVMHPTTDKEIHYQLGDNAMVSLDADGNKIEGEGFELYTLKK